MFIALDIGGTHTRIGFFKNKSTESRIYSSKFFTSDDLKDEISEIRKNLDVVSDIKVEGVGASIASRIGPDGIIYPPNLKKWQGKNLRDELEAAFKCPSWVVNDAYAGALAEEKLGKSPQKRFGYLVWGTGFGGAIVDNGSIENIEPGHIRLRSGRQCSCGKNGCIEAYLGGNSIEKHLNKKMSKLSAQEWTEILDDSAAALKIILVKYNFKKCVFNGGTVLKKPEIIKILEERVRLDLADNEIEFEISRLGDEASVMGALFANPLT